MDIDYDWVSAIITMILRLEVNNMKTRREVYEAAYNVQNATLDQHENALAPEDVLFMRKFLRYAITAVENDIRSGVDISTEGYLPNGLAEIEKSLRGEHEVRTARRQAADARALRLSGDDLTTSTGAFYRPDMVSLRRLQIGLASLAAEQYSIRPGQENTVAIIRAVLIHSLIQIANESRLSLLWTLIAPAIMLGLANCLYLLSGTTYVLNMDVATFTLTGHITWFMLRTVVFRISGAYVFNRGLINIPLVNILHVTVAYGIVTLLVFTVTFTMLLTAGYFIGIMTLPNSGRFIFPFLCVWLTAYSLGLIFGVIGSHWHFFLRAAPPIERVLQLFASVWFVSEQLPEDYKPYVLWFPMAHGIQLMRAGYFAGYTAPDASPLYFYSSVVSILMIALMMERRNRSHMEPS